MKSFHVLITGPESSGKSTLAQQLSHCLDAVYLAEYAREYLANREGRYEEADLIDIWRGQANAPQAYPGSEIYLHDTGPLVMYVWSDVRFGRVEPAINRAAKALNYDLVLLCAPDLPWVPDPLRETPDPDDRRRLFQRYEALLANSDVPWVLIRGQQRTVTALRAIKSLITLG